MLNNEKEKNILEYMAYGDALGFLRENSNNKNLTPFTYFYNDNLKLDAETGQWSYITQLMLINCKCLVDNKEKRQVSVDYKRIIKELKLWQYYRCGRPENYLHRLKLGSKYYSSKFYWEDKRGEAFSRIFPIVLANKNFNAAQEQVYKNIIYINRHPVVVLTGLLLLRSIYFMLNNKEVEKEKLIDDLKDYLIELQLTELEEYTNGELPSNYKIKFEQEKINYLMDIDRIKGSSEYNFTNSTNSNSKNIFISALIKFLQLHEGKYDIGHTFECNEKEIYAITYGLLGLLKNKETICTDNIKDIKFIKSMDNYLDKLKEYSIGKKEFQKDSGVINVFDLDKGTILKHPILNNIKIKERKQFNDYIELIIESKSGEYKFIKEKDS